MVGFQLVAVQEGKLEKPEPTRQPAKESLDQRAILALQGENSILVPRIFSDHLEAMVVTDDGFFSFTAFGDPWVTPRQWPV